MIRYAVYLILLVTVIQSCSSRKQHEAQSEIPHVIKFKLPELSEQQLAEGWKYLFDGNSLNGWRFYRDLENDSWEAKEGILHCKPFSESEIRSDLVTYEMYQNFEMTFDWKIAHQGNSGVMFRVVENYDESYLSGPEYQLLDDKGYPGDKSPLNMTGGNFGMHAPLQAASNPIGQWNTSSLIVKGNHVEHWLNGTLTLKYDILSQDWNERKNTGKWKNVASYGIQETGHIVLQDHAQEAWFRNILIKEL